jgi:hypothetical protein
MSSSYDAYYKNSIFDIPVYKSLNETVDDYDKDKYQQNIRLNNSIVEYIQDKEPFKNIDNLVIYKYSFVLFFFIIFFYFFILKKN